MLRVVVVLLSVVVGFFVGIAIALLRPDWVAGIGGALASLTVMLREWEPM